MIWGDVWYVITEYFEVLRSAKALPRHLFQLTLVCNDIYRMNFPQNVLSNHFGLPLSGPNGFVTLELPQPVRWPLPNALASAESEDQKR